MLVIKNDTSARVWFSVGCLSAILYGTLLQSTLVNIILHAVLCYILFSGALSIQFEVRQISIPQESVAKSFAELFAESFSKSEPTSLPTVSAEPVNGEAPDVSEKREEISEETKI